MSTLQDPAISGLLPEDLATFMGVDSIDAKRARLFLSLAVDACSNYVSPIPAGARGIILKLAAQGYSNPTPARTEHAGPFSVGFGPSTLSGVTPTSADVRQLRLLAGRGGAFTIDTMPSTVATGGMPWDENVSWLDGVPMLDQEDDAA